MAFKFSPPTSLRGTEKEQLRQVYTHLYKLSNELNTALNQVNQQVTQTLAPATVSGLGSSSSTTTIDKKVTDSYNALRSLIIKNADTVYATMDEIRQTLASDYVAQSEFGTYQENLETTIVTTAKNEITNYDYSSILKPINDDLAGFSAYQIKTEQYIKTGIVGEDEYGIPIVGIVVGNNLSEAIIDGKAHVVSENMYSCFTADRLSFWKNGVIQAYISNETLFITNINVTNEIIIGSGSNKWKIDTTNGFTIRNVG